MKLCSNSFRKSRPLSTCIGVQAQPIVLFNRVVSAFELLNQLCQNSPFNDPLEVLNQWING